uniref:Zinc finger, CCHC-type n=1 Tax=Tanacetum cinerariifolium TaxID=118510 RepID=A0A6L2J383_TANCI|nr:zinc finger, CCHC-type [Tanacetum cinerariifolium]
MGDENPIRTPRDYSKPSHEGYRNTIEILVWNKVAPLRSDTIWLVQNGCSFHGLQSEDPNQHLKDFLKLVDSIDLDGENKERTRLRLFQFSLRDKASNWLERLLAVSITTCEDLTTLFLAQLFLPGRTAKLCNDILMFQQHHGESLSEAWTRFKDLLQKVPHHGIDLWHKVQIFYDHVNPVTRRTIDQSASGKLLDQNAKESWALLEDLALYDNEIWNDPRDFAKQVKAIASPQDVPNTSDRNNTSCLQKMTRKKRTTRASPATTTTTTTPVTNAQLKALIDQGVVDTLAAQNQIKFATCALLGSALTWWNSHVKTVGHDVAYAMIWTKLKKKTTDKYCQRGDILKLEELALMCTRMFPEESDKIERYVGGLSDMIHESVMASKPKTMQDVVKFATELMDKKICTFAERQTENKRKQDDNQQQKNKRVGHLARDCGSPATTNNRRNLTCYECGNQGHYRSDCPELKNQNHRNQVGGIGARKMAHAVGGGETNQYLNNMKDDINA